MTLKLKRWISGAVVMALLLAGALALSWAPDLPVEALTERWASAASGSRFINVQGLQVHVRDEGVRTDAEPIVLLHGTAASLHTWDGWAAELAKTRRVIRFDLPGFGLTGPHEGKLQGLRADVPAADYSTGMQVRFVLAALDALGVTQPVVLGGNSLGGQVAYEAALQAPGRVSRLILVDAAGYPFEYESMPLVFRIALHTDKVPGLAWNMEHTLPRAIVGMSARNVYGDPSRVSEALVDRYEELALRAGNRRSLQWSLQQSWAAREQPAGTMPAVSARLRQIKQPTLILWGRKDRLIPPMYGEQFAKDISGSKLVMFDTLGHVPHEEDAAQTVAAVQAFLAGK
jgi:pimeloyl-ACP methyl ester carboxylesterase